MEILYAIGFTVVAAIIVFGFVVVVATIVSALFGRLNQKMFSENNNKKGG